MRTFLDFALEDPARCELLLERHIPGFTPSPESYALAEEVLGRAGKLLNEAGVTEQGDIDTDCTGWDVRKMALHVLGSGDAQASVREFVHQVRKGKPLNKEIDSHHWVDGLNELQIRERDHLSNENIVGQ